MSTVHPCVAPAERWPLGIALPCSPETADLEKGKKERKKERKKKKKANHLELDIFLKPKLEALSKVLFQII